MTPTDAFTAQIIELVRHMPDEAILALVKNQLAGVKVLSQSLATVAKARPGRPAGSKNAPKAAPAAAAAPAPAAAAKAAPKAAAKKAAGKKAAGKKPAAKKAAKAAPKGAKPAAAPAAAAVAKAPAAKKAAPKKAVAKAKAGKPGPKKGRGASSGRQEVLSHVERVVKAGGGLAASEVAKAAGIPQSRAAAALKELKLAKRIFQGGDRRFARYAGDAKAAEAASLHARKNAAGPQAKKAKKAKKK